jgi:hypothetical protein
VPARKTASDEAAVTGRFFLDRQPRREQRGRISSFTLAIGAGAARRQRRCSNNLVPPSGVAVLPAPSLGPAMFPEAPLLTMMAAAVATRACAGAAGTLTATWP